MNESNRITLTIVGLDKDNGDVELKAFLNQLDLFKKTLDETKRVLIGDDPANKVAYFKLVDLTHKSPARLVFEAVPITEKDTEKATALVDKLFNSIEEIDEGKIPRGFDYQAFEAYKNLPKLVVTKRIERIAITRNGDKPKPIETLPGKIDVILGPDEVESGSATGRLEYLNLHGNLNVFNIYPPHRLPKIKCRFPKSLRADVIRAIDKNVMVFGEKKFKPNIKDYHPYEMKAESIEILPDENLPKLGDLKGIAPKATGDKSSEEFIRGLRDGW